MHHRHGLRKQSLPGILCVFIQVYGTISACTTVFAVPCYSGMSSEMRCACSSVCHAEQLVRRMQDGLCLRAVVAYRSECPALCWGCRVAVLEATNLAATVLPTNANTDHTFTFRATLTLDSTMVVGDQPITFSFGDTASAVVTTNANGLAVATHKCACSSARRGELLRHACIWCRKCMATNR